MLASFILSLALLTLVSAQQYAGRYINNTLPAVGGSEIAFWNMKDANGKNVTFTNYASLNATGGRLPPANIKRVVLLLHGLNRDPYNYMANLLSAISQIPNRPDVTLNNVLMIAPYFPNGNDKNVGFPWVNSTSTTNALVWQGSGFAGGYNNQYPTSQATVSSFSVLDQLIQYYDNKTLFPNINQIVIGGHSLGAQAVQRYAAVGNVLNQKTPVSYWVANPNSLAWLSPTRPLATAQCSTYDYWRDGLSNFNATYGATVVNNASSSGRAAVQARYNSRQIAYARGTLDFGDDSTTCAPYTTGGNRNERFFWFIYQFPVSCTNGSCSTIDYVYSGHDSGVMSASTAGQARLFLDNFNGDKKMTYDIGCPRMQTGDDPYPDPACGVTNGTVDAGTYMNYTYQGCFTDAASSGRSLPYMAYDQTNSTIPMCVAACSAAGYTVAGTEFGTQCYCGSSLAATTIGPLLEASCQQPCAGDASKICGDSSRLSVFSVGNVTTNSAASTASTVGSFAYQGCYTEPSGSRALSASSLTTNNMTVEACAAYCSNYAYFGVEYSTQCFCDNTLASSSTLAASTDCSMTCNGDSSEFCGGSNRLNLYFSNSTKTAQSTSSSSGTATSSGPSSSSPSTATASSAASTSSTVLSCPAANGNLFNTTSGSFVVECYSDRAGGDMSNVQTSALDACINACATTTGCVDVAWIPGSPGTCYMKSTLVAATTNNGVWGARLANGASSASTATAAASTTGAATATATSTTLSCPAANGTTFTTPNGASFLVECFTDRAGGDFGSTNAASLDACMTSCSNTASCVDVAWVPGSPGPCYMKSSIVSASTNNGVWGARQIAAAGSSMSASPVSSSTSSASAGISSSSLSSSPIASSSSVASTASSTVASSSSSSTTPVSSSPLSSSSTSASITSSSTMTTLSTSSTASSPFPSSSSSSSTTTVSSSSSTTTVSSSSSTTTVSSSSSTTTISSSSSTTTVSSSTSSSSAAASPSVILPPGFSYTGCYTDSSSRTLPNLVFANSSNTPSQCALACRQAGYKYSGTEYSNECWCGNTLSSAAAAAAGDSDCSMRCAGDASQYCGAGFRLSVATDASYMTPRGPAAVPAYGVWSLAACYQDNVSGQRTLPVSVSGTPGGAGNMTVGGCLDACAAAGYATCGLEYYQECWAAAPGSGPVNASLVAAPAGDPVAAGCSYACRGDGTQACGGANRVLVYVKNGTATGM